MLFFLLGLFIHYLYLFLQRHSVFLAKIVFIRILVWSKIVFSGGGVWLFGSHILWLTCFRQWSWRPQVWLKKWKHLNYDDTRGRIILENQWREFAFLRRTRASCCCRIRATKFVLIGFFLTANGWKECCPSRIEFRPLIGNLLLRLSCICGCAVCRILHDLLSSTAERRRTRIK